MNKKTCIASALAVVGTVFGVAHAQELKYNPSVYIVPQVEYFNPDNRFGTTDKGPGVGLKFGKAINQWFDVQVGINYARVNGDNSFTAAPGQIPASSSGGAVRYQQSTIGIDGLYMLSRDRFRPFLLLGIGAENDRRNIPNRQNSRTSPYAQAGVGIQYIISDQWATQVDFRRVVGFQRSDVFGFSRDENNYVDVGLTYFFDKTPRPTPRIAQAAPPPTPPAATPPPPSPPPAPRFEKQTMSATELFAFDSSALRQPQPKLDQIAGVLKQNPQVANVRVTGYTDRIGSDKYNLGLSQRRANAVKTYLVSQGVESSRLTTAGKGKADPVVQCSEKNRPALIKCLEPNRRVEVEEITVEKRVQ